jgi:integrase
MRPYHPKVSLRKAGGYWKLRYRLPDGKVRERSIGSVEVIGAKAAELTRREFEAGLIRNPTIGGKAVTLAQWRERYMAVRTDVAPNTAAWYTLAFDRMVKKWGEQRRLDTLTPSDAQDFRLFIEGRKAPSGLKVRPQTVRGYMRVCKTIFAYAVKAKIIAENPFTHEDSSPLRSSKQWRYLTLENMRAMMDKAMDQQTRAAIAIARLAGLRAGEIYRLTWADVDFERRRLVVIPPERDGIRRETTKHRHREVPMVAELTRVLEQTMLAHPESRGPVEHDLYAMAYRVRKAAKAAGVGCYEKPLHTLRKNLETDWLAQHAAPNVAHWLGNSVTVAMDSYHKPRDEDFGAVSGSKMGQRAEKVASEAELQCSSKPFDTPATGQSGV